MSFEYIQGAERNSLASNVEPDSVTVWVNQALFVSAMHLPPPWLKGCMDTSPLDNIAGRVFFKMILNRRTT